MSGDQTADASMGYWVPVDNGEVSNHRTH
jgi:hypothetical protein